MIDFFIYVNIKATSQVSISCAQPNSNNIIQSCDDSVNFLVPTQLNPDTEDFQSTQQENLTYATMSQLPNYRPLSTIEFVDSQAQNDNIISEPPFLQHEEYTDQVGNLRKKSKYSWNI